MSVVDGLDEANDFLWNHLRTKSASATADLGEYASIALCATELPNAVFVTMDKGAAYLALAELGRGRVAAPFELWRVLRDAGDIEDGTLKNLCAETSRNGQMVVPRMHRSESGSREQAVRAILAEP